MYFKGMAIKDQIKYVYFIKLDETNIVFVSKKAKNIFY